MMITASQRVAVLHRVPWVYQLNEDDECAFIKRQKMSTRLRAQLHGLSYEEQRKKFPDIFCAHPARWWYKSLKSSAIETGSYCTVHTCMILSDRYDTEWSRFMRFIRASITANAAWIPDAWRGRAFGEEVG